MCFFVLVVRWIFIFIGVGFEGGEVIFLCFEVHGIVGGFNGFIGVGTMVCDIGVVFVSIGKVMFRDCFLLIGVFTPFWLNHDSI